MKPSACHPTEPVWGHGLCRKCYLAAYYQKNKPAYRAATRRNHLRQKYGLTEDGYEALRQAQRGCCAICERKKKLFVDHNHRTGKIRGLLCSQCNSAIAFLSDDCVRIHAAADYVERHEQR